MRRFLKRSAWITALLSGLLSVPALAEEASQAAEGARAFTIADAGRFFGMFLLVMAIIFGALLFTGWLGKWLQKHKK